MESFIRSKYESRRWALDGPPPVDPSVLDNGTPPQQQQQPTPPQQPTHIQSTNIPTRQPHELLSSNYTTRPAATPISAAAASPPVQQTPVNDLFSLDFHAPVTPVNNTPILEQKKDVKQNILSLFSAPLPVSTPLSGQFGQTNDPAAYWGAAQPQQQQQTTGMMGTNGTGMWGTASGWTPVQGNVWGSNPSSGAPQQQQQSSLFDSSAVWGNSTPTPAMPDLFTPTQAVQKKDDVFEDLWGGFK